MFPKPSPIPDHPAGLQSLPPTRSSAWCPPWHPRVRGPVSWFLLDWPPGSHLDLCPHSAVSVEPGTLQKFPHFCALMPNQLLRGDTANSTLLPPLLPLPPLKAVPPPAFSVSPPPIWADSLTPNTELSHALLAPHRLLDRPPRLTAALSGLLTCLLPPSGSRSCSSFLAP